MRIESSTAFRGPSLFYKRTAGYDLRCRGSIHSDTWAGTAAQLAEMEHLIVYPVNGWWRLRKQHKKYNNRIRYSLVVTAESEGANLDLFTPIQAEVAKVPISSTV